MNFKRKNNCPDKKGLSKTVISLITVIIILVTSIGFLTNYYFASQAVIDQFKSINVKLKNRNAELMNENVELMNKNAEITKKLLEIRLKLEETKIDLVVTKAKLETATFELGEEMLTLPKQSPKFDCDDSALYMYLYFTNLGYDVRIIAGNLDLEKETFRQCDHVWVWVDSGIKGELPYDWGHFSDDEQHSYGYVINYRDLLRRVINDQ